MGSFIKSLNQYAVVIFMRKKPTKMSGQKERGAKFNFFADFFDTCRHLCAQETITRRFKILGIVLRQFFHHKKI